MFYAESVELCSLGQAIHDSEERRPENHAEPAMRPIHRFAEFGSDPGHAGARYIAVAAAMQIEATTKTASPSRIGFPLANMSMQSGT